MPSITLKYLKQGVYDRLAQNNVFYSPAEVVSAINEAICCTNIETGILQSTATMYTVANKAIYDVPAEITMPIRISFERKSLDGWNLSNIGKSEPEWMSQRSAQQGYPPARWVGIGISKFGLNPAESYGARALAVVGVIEPEPLEDDDQVMQLPDETANMVIDYAAHVLMFDEGGGDFFQSMPLFKNFQAEVENMRVYKGLRSRAAQEVQRIKS